MTSQPKGSSELDELTQWILKQPDYTEFEMQQKIEAYAQSLLKSKLSELLEEENITYGGMGSDIPCVPVSAIQEVIEELK